MPIASAYDHQTSQLMFAVTHFSNYSFETEGAQKSKINSACNELVADNPGSEQNLLAAFYSAEGRMVSCSIGSSSGNNDIDIPVSWTNCKIFLLSSKYSPLAITEVKNTDLS